MMGGVGGWWLRGRRGGRLPLQLARGAIWVVPRSIRCTAMNLESNAPEGEGSDDRAPSYVVGIGVFPGPLGVSVGV